MIECSRIIVMYGAQRMMLLGLLTECAACPERDGCESLRKMNEAIKTAEKVFAEIKKHDDR